jgi:LPS O-antigen subunit length determinant protein (WzzB/FepE family)
MVDDVRPAYADDEIDLVELLQTIWDEKWTVVGIAVLAAVFGGLFAFLRPASFVATTEIKPITSTQAQAYRANNALGFFEISPAQLRGLFIEQLEERSLFEAATRKHKLIARADFESETDYEAAIVALAAEITIQPPVNVDGEEKGEIRRNWSVLFEGADADKWLAVLRDVKQGSTEAVRSGLVDRFNTALAVSKQSKAFQLEDIETSIENALTDYERSTSDRLEFLSEQALIARKLGVSKNTLEAQTFSASNGIVANVQSDTPFYLRGFEAIEKEIELIKGRENKSAFISGLLELEKAKRDLIQDKQLERAERLFTTTPVLDAEVFAAVEMEVFATEIESKSKRSLILALSLVLGGMVGVIFVLIRSAMRKRKSV